MDARNPAPPKGYSGSAPSGNPQFVVSGLFVNSADAEAAVRELREVGVPAQNISLISRDEDHTGEPVLSRPGVDREEVQDEGLTYRASGELPNDEDLPT